MDDALLAVTGCLSKTPKNLSCRACLAEGRDSVQTQANVVIRGKEGLRCGRRRLERAVAGLSRLVLVCLRLTSHCLISSMVSMSISTTLGLGAAGWPLDVYIKPLSCVFYTVFEGF